MLQLQQRQFRSVAPPHETNVKALFTQTLHAEMSGPITVQLPKFKSKTGIRKTKHSIDTGITAVAALELPQTSGGLNHRRMTTDHNFKDYPNYNSRNMEDSKDIKQNAMITSNGKKMSHSISVLQPLQSIEPQPEQRMQ